MKQNHHDNMENVLKCSVDDGLLSLTWSLMMADCVLKAIA